MGRNKIITYYNRLEQVSVDWQRIFNGSSLSYFCSPQWHSVVLSFLQKTFITKRINKIKYFAVRFDKDSEVSVVGFFYIHKRRGEKIIKFAHLLGPSDYYDFVCRDNVETTELIEIVQKIVQDHNASRFEASHIKEYSKLYKAVQEIDGAYCKSLDCVRIDLPLDYDTYLKMLSKSVRQNLRTAQNRADKNNITLTFLWFDKEDRQRIDFEHLKELYKERNKYKQQDLNWKSVLYKKLDNLFREVPDMFDLAEVKNTDYSLGILEMDGKTAAYFFGFEREKKIEINRVVINDEFKFYSPGMLLLNEYIKKGISENLKEVDLTVGDEKYKFDLGGITHQIFNVN